VKRILIGGCLEGRRPRGSLEGDIWRNVEDLFKQKNWKAAARKRDDLRK
jgi:hypothetical protein